MIFNYGCVAFLVLVQFLSRTAHGDDEFNGCSRYSSFGYSYRDFFQFRPKAKTSNYIFYFNFYVKTVSDAHVMLKSSISGNASIEVVIGGGMNTFSQIRYNNGVDRREQTVTRKTENIVSGISFRKFDIAIDKDGVIVVRRDNDEFLNGRLDGLFPIHYFGFSSWTNTKADWRFGCEKQSTDTPKDESPLSPLQKLKNDLFTLYNPNTMPNGPDDQLEVKSEFLVHRVELNEKRGELTMHGSGVLKWQDNKMKWNPKDYGGIDHIFIPPYQIWTPYLRILNALAGDKTPLLDLTVTGVIVTHEGAIFWRPPFKSVSSCEVDLTNWPYDVHNCSVLIGFWMEPTNLRLTIMAGSSMVTENVVSSEWNLLSATPLNGLDDDGESYGILYVELQRNQEPQISLLSVPCIASDMLSLTSFWTPVNNPNKFYLSCGSVMMLLITLFLLGQAIPIATLDVPKLISVYSWSVVIACFPILAFVVLKNFPQNISLSGSAKKFLNHNVLDRMFCLPVLPENESKYSDLNEGTKKLKEDQNNAVRLVAIIEKIFFLLYVCLLVLRYLLI